jgi:cellobiose-specific phosphotransferase system component IIC
MMTEKEKVRFYRLMCVLIGTMFIVIPMLIFSFRKYQIETNTSGIVVNAPAAYGEIINIGILGIALGLFCAYYCSRKWRINYLQISVLILTLIIWTMFAPRPFLGT